MSVSVTIEFKENIPSIIPPQYVGKKIILKLLQPNTNVITSSAKVRFYNLQVSGKEPLDVLFSSHLLQKTKNSFFPPAHEPISGFDMCQIIEPQLNNGDTGILIGEILKE